MQKSQSPMQKDESSYSMRTTINWGTIMNFQQCKQASSSFPSRNCSNPPLFHDYEINREFETGSQVEALIQKKKKVPVFIIICSAVIQVTDRRNSKLNSFPVPLLRESAFSPPARNLFFVKRRPEKRRPKMQNFLNFWKQSW